MPVSKHGEIQTDKNDGRKFITLRVGSNGHAVYRKVHLRTKDPKVAIWRAAALNGITDPEQARSIIAYLVKSPDESEEQRARQLAGDKNKPLVPALSLADAHDELTRFLSDFGIDPPDAETVQRWRRATPHEMRNILLALGVDEDALNEPDLWDSFRSRAPTINPHYPDQRVAWSRFWRRPVNFPPDKPARGPKLSACIAEFEKAQEQKGTTKKNCTAYIKKFQAFVALLNDKPIRSLAKPDFVRFADQVIKQKRGKSNKTLNDHLNAIGAVLEAARTRMDDGVFPEGLDHWLTVLDSGRRAYKPKLGNSQPMPPDVFRTLLDKADEWAECDPAAVAAALPVDASKPPKVQALIRSNNAVQAKRQKRDGLLGHVGLCLAANCGATAIDLVRLLWSDLSLDGKLPLFTQARTKTETNEDMTIPVRCPLLPETIRSLKRWKAHQDVEGGSDHVFTNDEGEPFPDPDDGSPITKIFARLRQDAKVDAWEARHLRNVGATLQRDHGLKEAVATAWLRHSSDRSGTNVFYRGVAPSDYLLPLVQVIGREYFGQQGA